MIRYADALHYCRFDADADATPSRCHIADYAADAAT